LREVRINYYRFLELAEHKQFQAVVDMDHAHPELRIELFGPCDLTFVKSRVGKDLVARST